MARQRKEDERKELTPDDKIIREAKDRFKRCQDWESNFQTLYKADVKFNLGDSDNGWQWPKDLRQEREDSQRPSLTINKTAHKVNLIVNDARQNKPSVSIKPVGDQTSFRAAQIYEGVVRHIEYISKAQALYDVAMESAVEGGIGWWRVGTDYVDDDTFDQQILILPIRNMLGVYLDPDIKQPDGSDAKYGFVFDDIPKSEAEREYGEADLTASGDGLDGPATWVKLDNVRVAEYYRIVETTDELIYMEDEAGHDSTFRKSDLPEGGYAEVLAAEKKGRVVKRRKIKIRKLEWYKIVGNTIVDHRKLAGAYVPLVRVIGQERVIDGELYRSGHVRKLKDPQRMYNYNSSGQIEFGALQTKTPWTGPKEAFEGNEDAWNRANTKNVPYLTYNYWDNENDRQIPAPTRSEAPGTSPAFVDGMKIAEHEIDMASGQYESQDGRQGNEKSGVAIAERQRQGDTATYHFIDHQALAVRYTGVIILDLVPHIYDTKRVIQIMGKDGTQQKVTIDPDQQEAIKQEEEDKEIVNIMFNPKIGKYIVEADIGPAYSTQRQEAWNAFVQIVTGAPDFINEIGDLMFKSADFPLADEIAQRLRKKIKAEKPYLFDDDAPTPQVQQMQQQIQELSQEVSELIQALAEKRLKLIGKEQMRDIDAFDAMSKRITALSNAEPELNKTGQVPELRRAIQMEIIRMLSEPDITKQVSGLGGENGGGQAGATDLPSFLNPRQGQDGNTYVQHPETGEPMMAEPLPQQ